MIAPGSWRDGLASIGFPELAALDPDDPATEAAFAARLPEIRRAVAEVQAEIERKAAATVRGFRCQGYTRAETWAMFCTPDDLTIAAVAERNSRMFDSWWTTPLVGEN